MPQLRHNKRFTIYDVMEARGDFEDNPANAYSRDAQGLSKYKKAEFPKMLYHPEGETRITRPAEAVSTPFGPKWLGEQRELIHKVVQDEEELNSALAAGWHTSPKEARRAAAKKAGSEFNEPLSPSELALKDREDENAKLRKQLAELTARNAELELGIADPKEKPASGGKK